MLLSGIYDVGIFWGYSGDTIPLNCIESAHLYQRQSGASARFPRQDRPFGKLRTGFAKGRFPAAVAVAVAVVAAAPPAPAKVLNTQGLEEGCCCPAKVAQRHRQIIPTDCGMSRAINRGSGRAHGADRAEHLR